MKNTKMQLKSIIGNLNLFLQQFESTKETIEGAFLRLDKLESYLEDNCIQPDSMNFEQMKIDIMACYAPFEDSMANALTDLDDLRESLESVVQKDANKKHIYEKLLHIENCIDIEENKISTIDDYRKAIKLLIKTLTETIEEIK